MVSSVSPMMSFDYSRWTLRLRSLDNTSALSCPVVECCAKWDQTLGALHRWTRHWYH